MSWIDAAIIAVFIGYSIVSGLWNRKASSQNLEEYFLAGRSVKGWHAGISMAATQFAADTPLLVTGLIATSGIFALWRLWIYALAFLLMGFLLAPSWRRARVLTDAELTEIRYGARAAGALRGVKAIYFGTIFNCTVLAMVLLAATRIAEPFLIWSQWLPADVFAPLAHVVQALGTPLTVVNVEGADVWVRSTNNLISIGAIVLVTTFYSTTGGLRSVIATDLVQFFIAILASVVFAWYVVDKAGGFWAINDKLVWLFGSGGDGGSSASPINADQILAFTPSRAKDASLAVLAVIGLQWLVQMNADGTGYLAQRSMACRSDRDARQAAVVFTVCQVLVRSLIWLPLGLGLLVVFPPDWAAPAAGYAARREFTFVRGIAELLPAGAKGLMLVGMLAALASTLDTHLNWGSSYWTNDIFKRFVCKAWLKREPGPRTLVWVARGANILILVIAFLILPALSSIQKAWQLSLMLGGGMGVLLILRWIWWRINAWGELGCIATSLVLAPVLLYAIPESHEALRLLIMAFVSTVGGVLASLLTPAEDMNHLVEFYKRVQPPGFWGPVAARIGQSGKQSMEALQKGVAATFLGAFSVFCILIGCGSWIAGSPSPTWFPWRETWIGMLLITGLGLVPVWVRLGFGPEREPRAT